MGGRFTRLGGREGRALAAAACALITAGSCASEVAVGASSAGPPIPAGDMTTPSAVVVRKGGATVQRDVADPVRLRVPAIGLSTSVIALRLDAKRRLIAPKQFDRVGWNKAGPEPGERGVAVIAGHVDSHSGPAVFYRLRDLEKGDRIHVDRADGSTTMFTVSRLARHPKNRIPDKEVYGSNAGSQLRLITCGGAFDRARRSYLDNVIVFADLRR